MQLSEEQEHIATAAKQSIEDGNPEYRIGGFAGTGKTTIVREILNRSARKIAVCAFTGKAASVLCRKGVDATTIHSLIYEFEPKTRTFDRKAGLDSVQAIIVDEASMVNEDLYDDLSAFGLPIVFVGDHGQLEPIGNDFNLMREETLDAKLETIHRQAEGNPIIEFSIIARTDQPFWHGDAGAVQIIERTRFWNLPLHEFDQILCGKNGTRHQINSLVRRKTKRTGTLCTGEKILCLQNNKELGVFNGQLFEVLGLKGKKDGCLLADLKPEFGPTRPSVPIVTKYFGKDKDNQSQFEKAGVVCDYGYALTCHKAQGSEWPRVAVLDEAFGDEPRRWRYTAITRASEELVYCV